MALLKKAKHNITETNKNLISQTATMLAAAFVFVAGLAWNDAVKAFIDRYFNAGSGVYSRFIYAILVTLIAVLVTTRLNRIAQRFHERSKAD